MVAEKRCTFSKIVSEAFTVRLLVATHTPRASQQSQCPQTFFRSHNEPVNQADRFPRRHATACALMASSLTLNVRDCGQAVSVLF